MRSRSLRLCIGWLATRIMPEQLVRLFNNEPELDVWNEGLANMVFVVCQLSASKLSLRISSGHRKNPVGYFLTLTRQIILIPAILLFQTLGEWMACRMRHLLLMQAPAFDGNSFIRLVSDALARKNRRCLI